MTSVGPLGLQEKEKGGVFYLFGDDAFRKEEEARALVDWHLDPGTRDFNYDPLRGSEVSVENLASILATPPMMAEWRVVLLREVEALASSPPAREARLDVVKSPPPGRALILVARNTQKWRRTMSRVGWWTGQRPGTVGRSRRMPPEPWARG
jgi:DNA polymerase III delta subunit